MGKHKTKKQKKNEKPKNQFGIESFFGLKKEPKKNKKDKHNNLNNSNVISNEIKQKESNDENINNNEDEKNKDINDENKVNLSFFNQYIFGITNSNAKRTYNDLDITKNNNYSKNYTNTNLHLSKEEINSCYNPLTQYPKIKEKSSIGSKQKRLYSKFNLKFHDETNKKEKDLGLELMDNYGFSETNFNSNKEIFTNPSLSNDINKKNNNIIKNPSKEKKDINKEDKDSKNVDEKFIYIGDDDNSEENEVNFEHEEKEVREEKDNEKLDLFNLDDYKNTVFTLDKF